MDNANRIENHLSPANLIPEKRRIIQQEVIEARQAICDFHRKVMETGVYGDWPEKAQRVLDRAHGHMPGQRGASTFSKGDIVR